ncbi:hypothetical protein PFICI_13552 [Pestalotiopsis fici W106-1]|uniref:Zn(2)-C6 fungal-type domain-containing protein n=1 Tax=Pestalotiopsis fici (strain W106-1 / CGMCC3.15140) TaxID=1229662 RepID=W3WMH2_PESFW|nr:uncharacterized protein PFICI_13552 [Pestalotiopsis fici W106-1]ETS75068.1 hypothetical protein PFICI_13552 [Pestalotiopsis fici W106-1]
MAPSNQTSNRAPSQLSCELCRDRKIKCDKQQPCSHCRTAGVACVAVHRLRLPRGRHAARIRNAAALPSPASSPGNGEVHHTDETHEELKARIRRLERLVQSMSGSRTTLPSTQPTVSDGPRSQEGPDEFWQDLVQEVEQLRDIVSLNPGEADNEIAQASDHTQSRNPDGGLVALGIATSTPSLGRLLPLHLDKDASAKLCEVYLRQVDPIIKILHRSSLANWMMHGQDYLKYPRRHPSTDALGASVCYLAISSMAETKCAEMLNVEKEKLMSNCRRECEVAFEKSGLLTTRDITVLQAFILYLVARGVGERSRAVWTLLATAVRIAQGLRLHLNFSSSTSVSFFEQQMRKRLWLTICLMDFQNALAQASKPIVPLEEITPSLPFIRHINDADFGTNTHGPVSDREGITDISYALVKFHLLVFGRRMGDGSNNAPSSSVGIRLDWEVAQQHVQEFEQSALKLLHFCDPESSSYAWFVWHGTQLFVAGARLSALRPLYRAEATRQPAPPRAKDNTEVLQQTVKALEKMELMHTDSRGENYRWMVSIQWHILAVAIAECYVCPDQALVCHAWTLIKSLYQRYERLIMRNSGQPLKGPLGKLMRRTREKLEGLLVADTPRSATDPRDYDDRNQAIPTNLPLQAFNMVETQLEQSGPVYPSPEETSLFGEQVTSAPTTDCAPNSPWDQSWKMWDEFMIDMSFDDLDGANSFF